MRGASRSAWGSSEVTAGSVSAAALPNTRRPARITAEKRLRDTKIRSSRGRVSGSGAIQSLPERDLNYTMMAAPVASIKYN
jgi:hypothetical protein